MKNMDYEYSEEIDYPCVEDVYYGADSPPKQKWMKWTACILLCVTFVAIVISVDYENMTGSLFAFFNCCVTAVAIIKLANKGSLLSVFPIFFLIWLIMGFSLAPIYFSISFPDFTYNHIQALYKNVKLQMVVLCFLVPYLIVTFWSLKNAGPYKHTPRPAGNRLNFAVLMLFTFSAGAFAIIKITGLPGDGVAGTFLNYTMCIPFVLGLQITYMSKKRKIIIAIVFAGILFFFALANARRNAMIPIMSFMVGLFLLSKIKTRTKLTILVVLFFAFPAYMVIGNTVRTILGEVGYEDMAGRAKAMKEWKSVAKQSRWADSTFVRLFSTGGHSVVTMTPEEVPFLGFEPDRYLREMAISFVPGKILQGMKLYFSAKYVYNFNLNRYGFHLTEEHQVGISIIGHLWMLGGYPFIIGGAIFLGLMQWIVFAFINRSLRSRPEKGVFYAGFIMSTFMWMSGRDLIIVIRGLFWQVILAIAFYYIFIAPFLKRFNPEPVVMEYIDEGEYGDYEDIILEE